MNLSKKWKKKPGISHTPSPFVLSLVSSLSNTVKMKENTTRGGKPLSITSKTKGNMKRRGFSLPVMFKTKGNMTRRGKIPPHHICHFCWVNVVEKGKMGGAAQLAAAVGGVRYWKRIPKKWHTLYAHGPLPLPCPFPSLPCTVLCCCHPPFVFSGTAGGWLREGGMAANSKRWQCGSWWRWKLGSGAWKNGLGEILNNDLTIILNWPEQFSTLTSSNIMYYISIIKIYY